MPKGVKLIPYLDREELIDRTIQTVSKNLLEGGIIVIFVLVILLGNLRAGIIVASVIPLSMLFAISMMVLFNVSGNLMSLGAIDFGLIVDGAVIIVENCIHVLMKAQQKNKSETILQASAQMVQSSIFGQIIILIVYLPLLTLSGIEGKMFKPMALTVIFALVGAIILSLTYVPMMSDLFLRFQKTHKKNLSEKFLDFLTRLYTPILNFALKIRYFILISALIALIFSFGLFNRLGSEFITQLDERDYAIEVRMLPGTSISQMVKSAALINKRLIKAFPDELKSCTGKIGTSEIPMDPMSIEEMDMVLTMHNKEKWKRCHSRKEFETLLEEELSHIPGVFISIQQPIAMRFNELMTGAKTDVIIKILGNDLDKLLNTGNKIQKAIQNIPGATDISIAKAEGLPQLFITYDRNNLLRYGVSVEEVSTLLQTAVAGKIAGILYENNQRFDIVVKMELDSIQKTDDIGQLLITTASGSQILLSEVVHFEIKSAPMAVFREEGERNLNVSLNVRGRDIQSVVTDIQKIVQEKVKLPQGYRVSYGGQFENLINAQNRLKVVVPAALLLILILLYLTFSRWKETFIIFSAIPFSMMGGIIALWLRDMPFSISAGVGFIALFGVAVLNGMVLISKFNELEMTDLSTVKEIILQGTAERLRPVVMTATVASLGFFPMAFSEGAGAEVQKPLATVVIGGLCSATLLTLIVLPIIYFIFSKDKQNPLEPISDSSDTESVNSQGNTTENLSSQFAGIKQKLIQIFYSENYKFRFKPTFLILTYAGFGQRPFSEKDAVHQALQFHPSISGADIKIRQKEILKETAFTLPNLEVKGLSPDPLNNYYMNFEGVQSFENPKVYKQNAKVLEQEVRLSKAEKAMSEFEIVQKTKWLYQNVLFFQAQKSFLKQQDSTFFPFLKVAETEFKTGIINSLEKMNIESRYLEIQNKIRMIETEEMCALRLLKSFTGITDSVLRLDDFTPLTPPKKPDFDYLPHIQYLTENQRLMMEKKIQYDLRYLPVWNVSIMQQINPFQSFVIPVAGVGMSIPVYKKNNQRYIQSAQLEVEIAKNQIDNAKYELEQTYIRLENEYLSAKMQLALIEETLIPQAKQTLESAAKLSRLGEITALEYLLLTKDAYQIFSQRLDAILRYNSTILELRIFSENQTD